MPFRALSATVHKQLMKKIGTPHTNPTFDVLPSTHLKCTTPFGIILRDESRDVTMPCPVPNSFPDFSKFLKHLEDWHLLKPFVCIECRCFFKTKRQLVSHQTSECKIANTLRCQLCHNKQFRTKRGLTSHMRTKHKVSVGYHKCPFCIDVLKNTKDFRRHIRTFHPHQAVIACTLCVSTFTDHCYLRKHMHRYHKDTITCSSSISKKEAKLPPQPSLSSISIHNMDQFLPTPTPLGTYFCYKCPFKPCPTISLSKNHWLHHVKSRHLANVEIHNDWLNKNKFLCRVCGNWISRAEKRHHLTNCFNNARQLVHSCDFI